MSQQRADPHDADSVNRERRRTEQVRDELLAVSRDARIDLRFVAEEAGDRPVSPRRGRLHAALREQRGARFYRDILYALSHQYFPTERAEAIWARVLEHRDSLNAQLGRNVGVAVAALDYMSNVGDYLDNPTVVSEPQFTSVFELALRDGLTGLYNHAVLLAKLANEIMRHERYGNDVSLIMIDIDHFKHYNDAFGHLRGDTVLQQVSTILTEEIRDVDLAARYGGEEFAIVLPQTSSDDAAALAQRIRVRVEEELATDGVTISLGVATCPEAAHSDDDLLQAADVALYGSKRAGRNRVTLSTSFPSSPGSCV